MGCTVCIPRKANKPTQSTTTNDIVIHVAHDFDSSVESEAHRREHTLSSDEDPVIQLSANNNVSRLKINQERPTKVKFEEYDASESFWQTSSRNKSQQKQRRRRRANNYREFRDNGHRSFAGHSFIKEIFEEKLGLTCETHEETMRINGRTYNPDIKFTWNRMGTERILVYCEIKCVKKGAFTKLVQQVQTGRNCIETKRALFVGFLMRERKNGKMIFGSKDPLVNFQKLEFVICEGYHAYEFINLVKGSGQFKLHPLFKSLS